MGGLLADDDDDEGESCRELNGAGGGGYDVEWLFREGDWCWITIDFVGLIIKIKQLKEKIFFCIHTFPPEILFVLI